MIDFHTHILPGIDDGSRSIAESTGLLSVESQQGITHVILTPHYYADENSPSEFLIRRSRAWEKLRPHLTPDMPSVHLGAEVQYFEGICAVADICSLKIEDTDYLLLEMPYCRWTDRMINDILELNDRQDVRIVLAHVERYMDMQLPGLYRELHSGGVLMQCNVSFFTNWKTRYRAMRMLVKGEIDFLGSDCHSMRNRRPNWDRLPPRARERIRSAGAYALLAQKLR